MFDYVVGLFFMLLSLTVGYFGYHGFKHGHFPGSDRQDLTWGEHRLSITNLGVFLILVGLGSSFFTWVFFVRGEFPEAEPDVVHPTSNVGPDVAAPATSPGPWQAASNGVVLTVATVDYGEDHLAQVRFRLDNRSRRVVTTEGDPDDYVHVVDNFGRGRSIYESSFPDDGLELGPGQSTFGRVAVGQTWATNTESFDVRVILTYKGSDQFFTLTSPGVPIPVEQRVGG